MSEKIKYQLEVEVQSSTKVLYSMISTPGGLSEWFADDVNIKNDIYSFIWDRSSEEAMLLSTRKGESIKCQWLDDFEEGEKTYFELAIKVDELTKDVALIITDFAEDDEINEAKQLWINQINDLKKVIGS
jgi:hypothetical protein